MESALNGVAEKVRTFVESSFDGGFEIYDVVFKGVERRLVLEVFIDSPDGIRVEDCERVSRALSKYLDDEELIHRRYVLEVSSPGAERILKRQVDFERHVGRLVRWVLRGSPEAECEVFQARLLEFSPARIVVATEEGPREFSPAAVEQARAVFEFPRKARG
ncbi:MAG: ribosome maturation factor RimP [Candidatus Ozemobacteraceae bacterium]